MQIHSLQSTSAVQSLSRTSQPHSGGKSEAAVASRSSAVDELELSSDAQAISQTQALGTSDSVSGGIRTEKVAALREAIASGTYETPENLSAALDKLLDTFA